MNFSIRIRMLLPIAVVLLMLLTSVTLSVSAFSLSVTSSSTTPCAPGVACCAEYYHPCGTCVGNCVFILNFRTLGRAIEHACWNDGGQMTSWSRYCPNVIWDYSCGIQHC